MKYVITLLLLLLSNFVYSQDTIKDTLVTEIRITRNADGYTITYSKDLAYEDKEIVDLLASFFVERAGVIKPREFKEFKINKL